VVAVAVQDPAGDLAQGGFVFDDQDRLAVAALGLRGLGGGGGQGVLGEGQQRGRRFAPCR